MFSQSQILLKDDRLPQSAAKTQTCGITEKDHLTTIPKRGGYYILSKRSPVANIQKMTFRLDIRNFVLLAKHAAYWAAGFEMVWILI